jgi:protein TonB
MTTGALVIGAAELRMAARRYWIWGFVISMALHGAVLLAVHLSSFRDLRPPLLTLTTPQFISVPGGGVVPSLTPALPRGHAGRTVPRAGTFEPVQDPPAHTDDPTLPGGGTGLDPGGTGIEGGGGEGGNGGEGLGIVDDPSPEGFIPVEKLPVVIRRTEPVYPELAVKAGLTGKVWLKMLVDREGKVRKVLVVKSDADIFSEAATDAARQWLFVPAVMNGGPVSVWVTVPFTFTMR